MLRVVTSIYRTFYFGLIMLPSEVFLAISLAMMRVITINEFTLLRLSDRKVYGTMRSNSIIMLMAISFRMFLVEAKNSSVLDGSTQTMVV
jgi:hypothetical protein